jgi:hypothetical protein
MIYGRAELVSPPLSSRWRLVANGAEVAQLRRSGRLHISRMYLPDGTEVVLAPAGHSVVHALAADGTELARITRRSWFGRRWEVASKTWAYELVSHPRPRRWYVAVGGTPVADIRGSALSYNRVKVDAQLGLPILAVALAWHVVARPWEAAAAPATLIAAAAPVPEPEHR